MHLVAIFELKTQNQTKYLPKFVQRDNASPLLTVISGVDMYILFRSEFTTIPQRAGGGGGGEYVHPRPIFRSC